jgi:DNA-directed RNA polymerase subunit RPC12/RpoP
MDLAELRNHVRLHYYIDSEGHLVLRKTGKRFSQRLPKPFNTRNFREPNLIYLLDYGVYPEKIVFRDGNHNNLSPRNLMPAGATPVYKKRVHSTGLKFIYRRGSRLFVNIDSQQIYSGPEEDLLEAACHALAWAESCRPSSIPDYDAVVRRNEHPKTYQCLQCGFSIKALAQSRVRTCPHCHARYWWMPKEALLRPELLPSMFKLHPDGFIYSLYAPNEQRINSYRGQFITPAVDALSKGSYPSHIRHQIFPRSVLTWAFFHGEWPPEGKNIRFRDGNPDNCSKENMYINY